MNNNNTDMNMDNFNIAQNQQQPNANRPDHWNLFLQQQQLYLQQQYYQYCYRNNNNSKGSMGITTTAGPNSNLSLPIQHYPPLQYSNTLLSHNTTGHDNSSCSNTIQTNYSLSNVQIARETPVLPSNNHRTKNARGSYSIVKKKFRSKQDNYTCGRSPSSKQDNYTCGRSPSSKHLPPPPVPSYRSIPNWEKGMITTFWEDERTVCYQMEANGVSVVRRADNNMVNGTKLLNVTGMTRGRRDGILKAEKTRYVVKIGSMHLKGVWIDFDRAVAIAKRENIYESLKPLFAENIETLFRRK